MQFDQTLSLLRESLARARLLLYHAEQRNSERPTVLYSAVTLNDFLQLLLLQWSCYPEGTGFWIPEANRT